MKSIGRSRRNCTGCPQHRWGLVEEPLAQARKVADAVHCVTQRMSRLALVGATLVACVRPSPQRAVVQQPALPTAPSASAESPVEKLATRPKPQASQPPEHADAPTPTEEPKAPSTPTAQQLSNLFWELHPHPEEATLLLGIRHPRLPWLADIKAENLPPAAYHTLAFHFGKDGVTLDTLVPYLVIPQGSGFQYVGNATVGRDETGGESPAEQARIQSGESVPRQYSASTLWSTTSPSAIVQTRTTEQQRLGRPNWGSTLATAVVYVTPRARCIEEQTTEWRGGALAFEAKGKQWLEVRGQRARVSALTRYGKGTLDNIARSMIARQADELKSAPGGSTVDNVEQPASARSDEEWLPPWGQTIRWSRDVVPCLLRTEGVVFESGVVTLHGNSSHSFAEAVVVRPAAPDWVPENRAPLRFTEVGKVFTSPLDVVVAPSDGWMLVVFADRIEAYDVRTRTQRLVVPASIDGIVMAEWAERGAAARWARQVHALPQ